MMKKKIKIVSINFDTKVKILIVACVIIAISIIMFSFYYICIDSKQKSEPIEIDNINQIMDLSEYEAEYQIRVAGNRTINTYDVKEVVDLENETYNMNIDDLLNIDINANDTKIQKKNMDNIYITSTKDIVRNNPFSFSSVIECYNLVNSKKIDGSIKKVEQDEKCIYTIQMNEEVIEKVRKIVIYTLKEKCKIIEIKMYNLEENELYTISFKSFIVKK